MYQKDYLVHLEEENVYLYPESIDFRKQKITLENGLTYDIYDPNLNILRCTQRTDNSGALVYEGDRLRDTTDDIHYTVYWDEHFSEWRVGNEREDHQLSSFEFFLIDNPNPRNDQKRI